MSLPIIERIVPFCIQQTYSYNGKQKAAVTEARRLAFRDFGASPGIDISVKAASPINAAGESMPTRDWIVTITSNGLGPVQAWEQA